MPNAGHSVTVDMHAHSGNRCVIGLLFFTRHWHCACTLILQRGGRHLMTETDSAANQFGAPESVEDPRHISVVSGLCLPLASF